MRFVAACGLIALLCAPSHPVPAQEPVPASDRGQRARAKIPLFQDAVQTEDRFVAADALHRRQRAMIERGETFTHSLERVTADGAKKRPAAPPPVAPVEPPVPDHTTKILVAGAFLALGAALRLLVPARHRAERGADWS